MKSKKLYEKSLQAERVDVLLSEISESVMQALLQINPKSTFYIAVMMTEENGVSTQTASTFDARKEVAFLEHIIKLKKTGTQVTRTEDIGIKTN